MAANRVALAVAAVLWERPRRLQHQREPGRSDQVRPLRVLEAPEFSYVLCGRAAAQCRGKLPGAGVKASLICSLIP